MATEIWNMAVATTDALTPKSKNPSIFSGAIDIIIIKHNDGTYRSTPFHARFGKYLSAKPKNLIVDITINGEKLDNLNMTLNKNGIAYFDGIQNKKKEENEINIDYEKEEEEKAETTTTDDGSGKIDKTSSNNEQPQKKKERKRDKLKSLMKSPWSYRSGLEAKAENEQQEETKNNDDDKNKPRIRKRDIIKGYITVCFICLYLY